MIQPSLYVFSKTEEMKNSLSRYIKYIGIDCEKDSEKLKHKFDPKIHTKTYSFIEEITSTLDEKSPNTIINTAVVLDVSDISESHLNSWDPISESLSPPTNIAASLVLAYPEVYWIFIGMYYNKPEDNLQWLQEHFVDPTDKLLGMKKCTDLLKRHQNGYRPIFDPSGLRTWIKEKVIEIEKQESEKVPEDILKILKSRKNQCAVAIDEEFSFTFLNGYTAYRCGYRCYMITSKAEMDEILSYKSEDKLAIKDLSKKLRDTYNIDFNESDKDTEYFKKILQHPSFYEIWLGKGGNPGTLSEDTRNLISETKSYRAKNFSELCYEQKMKISKLNKLLLEITFSEPAPKILQIELSYEDKDLKFHDMKNSDETNINDLYTRYENYPVLPEKYRRIIVTGVLTEVIEEKDFKIVRKPYSGIYDLVDNSPMLRMQVNKNKSISTIYLQIDRQFIRPIISLIIRICKKREKPNQTKNKPDSHSSRNQILSIVDSLLNRTQKIAKNANTCKDSVHSAILALEAKELLLRRSITTALETVSLQHQMEVRAECWFYGVAHEIEIKQRFIDIAREVDETIKIKNKPVSEKLAKSYNAQIEIINNIRLIFKEFEQFDEEDKCICFMRRLRQGIRFYSKLNVLNFILKFLRSTIIEKYFNWLVSSLINILLSMAISIISFAGLYCYWDEKYDFFSVLQRMWQSALTFFEMQPANIIKEYLEGSGLNFILFSELFVAYVHLGIFITYLYQKLSRR